MNLFVLKPGDTGMLTRRHTKTLVTVVTVGLESILLSNGFRYRTRDGSIQLDGLPNFEVLSIPTEEEVALLTLRNELEGVLLMYGVRPTYISEAINKLGELVDITKHV